MQFSTVHSFNRLNQVVLKVSNDIDLDSENDVIRKHSERTLAQEIHMAEHLVQNGYVMIKLKPGKSTNLARHLQHSSKCVIWTEIPMTDTNLGMLTRRKDIDVEQFVGEDMWDRWNRFRCHANFSHRIRLALTLTEDIPSQEEIKRWLGEPVDCIIIPDYLFVKNSQNYPVLSKLHQNVLAQFLKFPIYLMLKTCDNSNLLKVYVDYLDHLATQKLRIDCPMTGFDDLLQIPLQPLYDNLDSYTYEVFEKDPVKYKLYQMAVEKALLDRVPERLMASKVSVVMIVGAGRGPLVRAVINASKAARRLIKIYIVEKNPNAIITLNSLREELWESVDIQIFSQDMRECDPPEKADIIVSELLGSFGDNELSPECLDGAQRLLKPGGISIPRSSTSFINPIMSSKLHNAVRMIDRSEPQRNQISPVAANYENTYVVYPKNVYHIANPQKLFTFTHPTKHIDNDRFSSLVFQPKAQCVLHGFIGYFEAVLYRDITLSIHPFTHTEGLSSWFSFFLPITEPQQVGAGQEIVANFWRCASNHKVWYEWSVSSPQISHIHNIGGRCCPIYK